MFSIYTSRSYCKLAIYCRRDIYWCSWPAQVLPTQYILVTWDCAYIVPWIYIGAVEAGKYCPINIYLGPIGENILIGQYILGPCGCQYIDGSIYIGFVGATTQYYPVSICLRYMRDNLVTREADQSKYILCHQYTPRTIYIERFQQEKDLLRQVQAYCSWQ